MNAQVSINDLNSFVCDSDTYYFVSPYGLGDTLVLVGLRKEIEKQLKGKIHFIIKASHTIIMQLYGIKDYTTISFTKQSLFPFGEKTPKPHLGKIFIAHPDFHPWAKDLVRKMKNHCKNLTFLNWYKDFLNLPLTASFEKPLIYPAISESLKKKLDQYGPIEKIALLLPEAHSIPTLKPYFWEELTNQLRQKGYTVLSNTLEKSCLIKDVPNISLTLEELLALSKTCKEVHALRSGICDLIACIPHTSLYVYYPTDKKTFSVFSLKVLFNKHNIQEIIVPHFSFYKKKKIYLFGVIPLLRFKEKNNKKRIFLFNFIPFFKKETKKDNLKYEIFGFPIFRKKNEKYKLLGGIIRYVNHKNSYKMNISVLGIPFFSRKVKNKKLIISILGIKVYHNKNFGTEAFNNWMSFLRKQAYGHPFLYLNYHSGESYYIFSLLRELQKKLKQEVFIGSFFPYTKQILEMFGFSKDYIDTHFIHIKHFTPSSGFFYNAKGKLLNYITIRKTKHGWKDQVHGVQTFIDDKKQWHFYPINHVIKDFLLLDQNTPHELPHISQQAIKEAETAFKNLKLTQNKVIFLSPETDFFGNFPIELMEKLINSFRKRHFDIVINTKGTAYDTVLNTHVHKIFLNFSETFHFIELCGHLVAGRSGFSECMQETKAKKFILYLDRHPAHFSFLVDVNKWVQEVYSMNLITQTNNFHEYFQIRPEDYDSVIKDILEKTN